MLETLKRHRLQRLGYSCGKKRREKHSSEWAVVLRGSPYVRWLILAAFLFALGLLARYLPQTSTFHHLGQGMGFAAMLMLLPLSLACLKLFLRETWDRNSRLLLTYGVIIFHLAVLQGVWAIVRLNPLPEPESFLIFLAPVALAPMLLTLLLDRRHGMFAVLFVNLFGAVMVDSRIGLHFAIIGLFTGIVSVRAVCRLRKRGQLLRAGIYAGLAALVAAALLGRVEQVWFQGVSVQAWQMLGTETATLLASGIFTAMLVGALLPVLEAIFGITTTVSWIELSDLNHPLLRRMTLEAPGTYQHSLMVANLAEAAAESVGADPTICRVCSYFHDIGKLVKPEYCIENFAADEENPHDDLAPTMSALVVMAHVKDGIDLACRNRLNREIMDVIEQHHGNSLVYYFYRKALDQQEAVKKAVAAGEASPGDVPEVKESSFRYPGLRPSFRESAIISLADAVESASRTLSKPTPQKIETLVEDIARSRIRDGQLDECDLTMRDLKLIRESFVKTLRTSMHRRIPYPDEKEKRERDETMSHVPSEREKPRSPAPTPTASPKPETGAKAATNIIPMPRSASSAAVSSGTSTSVS